MAKENKRIKRLIGDNGIIEKADYIVPNDEFRKIYNKALEKNMKGELIYALKESHELFDNELPNVTNKAYYDLSRDNNNKTKYSYSPSRNWTIE